MSRSACARRKPPPPSNTVFKSQCRKPPGATPRAPTPTIWLASLPRCKIKCARARGWEGGSRRVCVDDALHRPFTPRSQIERRCAPSKPRIHTPEYVPIVASRMWSAMLDAVSARASTCASERDILCRRFARGTQAPPHVPWPHETDQGLPTRGTSSSCCPLRRSHSSLSAARIAPDARTKNFVPCNQYVHEQMIMNSSCHNTCTIKNVDVRCQHRFPAPARSTPIFKPDATSYQLTRWNLSELLGWLPKLSPRWPLTHYGRNTYAPS